MEADVGSSSELYISTAVNLCSTPTWILSFVVAWIVLDRLLRVLTLKLIVKYTTQLNSLRLLRFGQRINTRNLEYVSELFGLIDSFSSISLSITWRSFDTLTTGSHESPSTYRSQFSSKSNEKSDIFFRIYILKQWICCSIVPSLYSHLLQAYHIFKLFHTETHELEWFDCNFPK